MVVVCCVQVAMRHWQARQRAEKHHRLVMQRCVHRLWWGEWQSRVKTKEERLAKLDERAAHLGRRRALRFWFGRWQHYHTITSMEKRASAQARIAQQRTEAATLHTTNPSSSFNSPLWWPLVVRSDELKAETWKKVNGWLSAYRAVSACRTPYGRAR